MLLVIERRRFARGADRSQAIGALLDVPVDEPAQGLVIDLPGPKRRDDCHGQARKLFAFGCHDNSARWGVSFQFSVFSLQASAIIFPEN